MYRKVLKLFYVEELNTFDTDFQIIASQNYLSLLSSAVQFSFQSATHFIQEDRQSVALTVIKGGSNDIPVSIAIDTQSFEAQGK